MGTSFEYTENFFLSIALLNATLRAVGALTVNVVKALSVISAVPLNER